MKKLLALLLVLTLALGLFPVTAAAAENETDIAGFELLFDGEPWKVYAVENLTDTLTPDDLNITLVNGNGETIPEDKYELVIGTIVWDEEIRHFIPADKPYSLTIDEESKQAGFCNFAAYASAKDGSGYTGETDMRDFMIWHRYSFNFFGANADFGQQYEKQSTWSWHSYYEVPANRIEEPVVHGIDYSDPAPENYTITYFNRVTGIPVSEGGDYLQKVYPEDNPLEGLPHEEGSYFARIDGKGDYYGTSYVDFDIVASEETGEDTPATSGETGDCEWVYDADTKTLTISGNGAMAPYDDEGNPAPWSSFEVKNLVIEDGVTWIRSYAFGGLDIESVTIPDSVTQIGMIAFMDCENLKSVKLSPNITEIGGGAFRNCKSFESIDLPEGLFSIGPFAFNGCENLSDVDFPDSVYDMGAGVFENTAWMAAQPDGAVYAGKVLLGYKGEAKEPFALEIKDGTVSVAAGAFSDMRQPEMITDIKFPSSLNTISLNSFWNCLNFSRIEIPATVTRIEPGGIGYGFDETIEDVIKNPNLTIAGVKGSAAEKYANENGFTFEEIAPAEPELIGDANLDGVVDIFDATLIQKYAVDKAELTDGQKAVADVNDDGVVDVLDASDIQKFAVEKITEFKKKAV